MWAENRRILGSCLRNCLSLKKNGDGEKATVYTLKNTTQRLSMNAQIKTVYRTKVYRISEDTQGG